jgi:hypothetical protein
MFRQLITAIFLFLALCVPDIAAAQQRPSSAYGHGRPVYTHHRPQVAVQVQVRRPVMPTVYRPAALPPGAYHPPVMPPGYRPPPPQFYRPPPPPHYSAHYPPQYGQPGWQQPGYGQGYDPRYGPQQQVVVVPQQQPCPQQVYVDQWGRPVQMQGPPQQQVYYQPPPQWQQTGYDPRYDPNVIQPGWQQPGYGPGYGPGYQQGGPPPGSKDCICRSSWGTGQQTTERCDCTTRWRE